MKNSKDEITAEMLEAAYGIWKRAPDDFRLGANGLRYALWLKDGLWFDSMGTEWASPFFDEKRCGLAPIWETRPDDPYAYLCKAHDEAFNRKKLGKEYQSENAVSISSEFIEGATKVGASGISDIALGVIKIIKAPIYIFLGGIYGLFRYNLIDSTKQKHNKDN